MTKKEAIEAMAQGKSVTHSYFSPEEWMKQHSTSHLEFEDGVIVSKLEFWKWREDKFWENDWSVLSEAE